MKACSRLLAVLGFIFPFSLATPVCAHCDALDGPVVEAAKLALVKGDVTGVLKWVNKDGVKEIRQAFTLTMKVRAQGEDARTLADRHFFETLVRIHRAGEGEPFTGLKPAGAIDPAFQAADKALRDGDANPLSGILTDAVQNGIRQRFAAVLEKKKHADESVESGRAFVSAYVEYAHFVEAIHAVASARSNEHARHSSSH